MKMNGACIKKLKSRGVPRQLKGRVSLLCTGQPMWTEIAGLNLHAMNRSGVVNQVVSSIGHEIYSELN